jgi:hypothetical protein
VAAFERKGKLGILRTKEPAKKKSSISFALKSSRLPELGGRGMSFNICRGTLGSLAMLVAPKYSGAGPAECSPRAIADLYCSGVELVKPEPGRPTMLLLPYVSILPPPTADVAPATLVSNKVLLTSAAAVAPFA